jgi:hypothetical protein
MPAVGTPNANPEYDVSGGLVDIANPNDFTTSCSDPEWPELWRLNCPPKR